MEVLRLHPLAQGELARRAPDFLDRLFSGTFKIRRTERLGPELAARIVAGGYPAALQRTTERRRSTWYRDYVDALLATGRDEPTNFCHFRDKDGVEVDIVIERGSSAIAGVEVKASATVTSADFRGLRKLKETSGKKFAGGVVLYDGETSAGFGEGLHAVPVRTLWERP